jgi:hypothetical protein
MEPNKIEEKRIRDLRWYSWLAYRRLVVLFRFILAVLAVLVTSLYLIFQVPFVQAWVIKESTKAISKATKTKITIGYFRMGFLNNLVLSEVYLEDDHRDTLLYCKQLSAKLELSPFMLLRQGLVVTELSLQKGRFFITKGSTDSLTNLETIINRIIPPTPDDPNKKRNSFSLVLRKLNLDDMAFLKNDLDRGQRLKIVVGKGRLLIDQMNLPKKKIAARFLNLDRIQVLIDELPYGPKYVETTDDPSPPIDSAKIDTAEWQIMIGEFRITNGVFNLHNYRNAPKKTTPRDTINFQHLAVSDISITINNFLLQKEVFTGVVKGIKLKEQSGFILEKLAAEEAIVSSKGIILNDAQLITPFSHIGDTLRLLYDDYNAFDDFPNLVRLDGRFNNAKVAIRDIMSFTADLSTNPFFRKNRGTVVELDGLIRGKINNLDGRNLTILLPDGTYFKGKFDGRDLAVKDEESLQLRIDQLRTNMVTLRDLLPNFDLPSNFNKLGRLNFSGDFVGFFSSFSLNGILTSSLGSADMDISLNLIPGLEKAKYSGAINLNNFDLGGWTGNPDFGRFSLDSKISNGVGLSGPKASAEVTANLKSFVFKNYSYENAQMEGNLQSRQFDGKFEIHDPNVDFTFAGKVDMSKDVPVYNFHATVNNLALQKLNFTKQDLILNGDVFLDLNANNISDLTGSARLLNFDIHQEDQTYHFDSINVSSIYEPSGVKHLALRSDVADGDIIGKFEIDKIPTAVLQYLSKHFPGYAQRIGIQVRDSVQRVNKFTYNIKIKESKGLHELIAPKLGRLANIAFSGEFDDINSKLDGKLKIPELRYGDVTLYDIGGKFALRDDDGDIELNVGSTVVGEKKPFAAITIPAYINKDTLHFGIIYKDEASSLLAKLDMDGKVVIKDKNTLEINLANSELILLERQWKIDPKNSLIVGKDYVDVQNFVISEGRKTVTLEEFQKSGLQCYLSNFNLDEINDFLNFDPLDFGGTCDIFASVGNLVKLQDINVRLNSDTLHIIEKREDPDDPKAPRQRFDEDWGHLQVVANMKTLNDPAYGYFSLTKDTFQIIAEGKYNLKTLGENENQKNGYFNGHLNIQRFPLKFAEKFIGNTLNNIYGSLDADLKLVGQFFNPDFNGTVMLNGGGLSVDFLKTHYTFGKQKVDVDNYLFDFNGLVIKDIYDNIAEVHGGIRHNHLRAFGFNAHIRTRNSFLALDTKKGDNKQFYGRALGKGEVIFSGSFDQPDIYVNAAVGDSTKLVIPVSNALENSELSFLNFVDKKKKDESKLKKSLPEELGGVSLVMDITANLGAVLQIVFNEQTGDIIQGQGKGAVQISVPRGGDFQMFGDITIEKGNYLFTFLNVVNKDFTVKKGGTLRWSGDPMGAKIDLEAEYKNLSASVANFIQEYLTSNQNLQAEASNNTDVDLLMHLQGDLLHPAISFDIAFPTLQGELKNFVDNKLRSMKQDPNELNKQVFGLIIAGQFLPSDFTLSGSQIITKTISEFVSNQLSQLVTQMFSNIIGEGRALSGLDFDIAYNQFQGSSFVQGQNFALGNVLQVSLQPRLFNDRLSFFVGGNFGLNSAAATTNGAFVGNDVIIEYTLSPDRSLKLRVYQKTAPDVGGRRLQIGTGLSFSREFDNFGEFVKSINLFPKKKSSQ